MVAVSAKMQPEPYGGPYELIHRDAHANRTRPSPCTVLNPGKILPGVRILYGPRHDV